MIIDFFAGFIELADRHWFIAWCSLWLGLPVFWIIQTLIIRLPNRILRSINILFRGWPPAHLDADGDWKPEPEGRQQ